MLILTFFFTALVLELLLTLVIPGYLVSFALPPTFMIQTRILYF